MSHHNNARETVWGPADRGDLVNAVDLMDGQEGPSQSPQCTARSKRTGERCGRRVPGGGVCRWHGGAAPQVQAKQEARVVLAQAKAQRLYAADFEERDPGDVLMAAVADMDSVVQRLKGQVEGQQFLTAHDLELLRSWLELAAKWSSVVLTGRLAERRDHISRQIGAQFHEMLTRVVTALGHNIRDPKVIAVITTEMRVSLDGRQS